MIFHSNVANPENPWIGANSPAAFAVTSGRAAVSVPTDTRSVHCLDAEVDLLRGRDASAAAKSAHRDFVVISTRNGWPGDWADGTAGTPHTAVNVRCRVFTRVNLFVSNAPETNEFRSARNPDRMRPSR